MVCDVALFYAERSGGIRTYLDEKARVAATSGAFEHHIVIPGRRERHEQGRHELRSLGLAASNGYRLPLGTRALMQTLRAVTPDVVVLHDPFWRPLSVTRQAHRLGALVVAAHHASPALNAAGIPGPDAVYLPTLRRIYQHAYEHVDAVMSMVDTERDAGRGAALTLRLGLHRAFRPGPAPAGEHLLYVGRLSLEKRIGDLLCAMTSPGLARRRLRLVGEGPARGLLEAHAEADRILAACCALVAPHGFREYYHPLTGDGLAPRRFGFSTLLVDLLPGPVAGAQAGPGATDLRRGPTRAAWPRSCGRAEPRRCGRRAGAWRPGAGRADANGWPARARRPAGPSRGSPARRSP
ncbi:MAG: hypothetical protein QOG59_2970 [Solirubrobacteraceae bacterium]|nr:hypothetical protein [Solirubrobacteraceae bacterium]